MKKLLTICLILCLFLTSCGLLVLRDTEGTIPQGEGGKESLTTEVEEEDASKKTEERTEEATNAPTETASAEEDGDAPRENKIGFYDEVTVAGVYTRLREFVRPWTAGVDIGCFDILLSGEGTLTGDSYKALWQETADASGLSEAEIYLALEYTLTNGERASFDISTYEGAEAAVAAGYVEIYLYDDVHQADGAWYSHLDAATSTEASTVTSVKVTAGDKIDEVDSITLTARVENSLDGIIKLIREE